MTIIVDIIFHLGIVSLVFVIFSISASAMNIFDGARRSDSVAGLLLGTIVTISLLNPIELPGGAIMDLRAGPLIAAGIYFGPIATLIAASMASLARYAIVGGPYDMLGTLSMIFYAAFGLFVGVLIRWRGWKLTWSVLLPIGFSSSLAITPALLVLEPSKIAPLLFSLTTPTLIVINTGATLLTGFALQLVKARADEQRELREAIANQTTQATRLRTILDTLSEGVVVFDFEGRIDDANTAFCTMTGHQRETVLASRVMDFFVTVSDEKGDQHLRTRLRRNEAETVTMERVARAKDGSEFPVQMIGRVLVLKSTRLIVAIIRDLREIRRYQQELAHAQKLEAIGRLTGGVAHDFNNILAVLQLNLEMIAASDDPERSRKIAGGLVQSVERGKRLTRQLLTFARRQALEMRPFSPRRMIEDLAPIIRTSVGEPIDVDIISRSVHAIVGDRQMLETAVVNLCINSRDAMPEGGQLRIDIFDSVDGKSVAPDPKAASYVVIRIDDTGFGMSNAVLERAFEPFYTTKAVGQGSGLGLSMAHGLVNQMGGRVDIESQEGEGCSIRLILPATEAETTRDAPSAVHAPAMRGRGESILLVEDDDALRETVGALLSDTGYRVFYAEDGLQALRLVRSRQAIDLVITDYRLPRGPDGLKLLSEPSFADIPIVLTSAYPEGVDLDALERRGVAFLQKPYAARDLAVLVRQIFDVAPQDHALSK